MAPLEAASPSSRPTTPMRYDGSTSSRTTCGGRMANDSFGRAVAVQARAIRQSTASAICDLIRDYVNLATAGRVVMTVDEVQAMVAQVLASARRIGGLE